MKKNVLFACLGLSLGLLALSCSKDDNTMVTNPTPQGIWVGTGQYGTGGGNPTYVFSINLKAGGIVDITGNNGVAIDNATGTWQLDQDSVKATYMYTSSSAVYTLAGKFSAGSNVMAGTIGLSPVTTGTGIFTVTRQ